eukprot:2287414-Karenia_brevis.AAC.1
MVIRGLQQNSGSPKGRMQADHVGGKGNWGKNDKTSGRGKGKGRKGGEQPTGLTPPPPRPIWEGQEQEWQNPKHIQ